MQRRAEFVGHESSDHAKQTHNFKLLLAFVSRFLMLSCERLRFRKRRNDSGLLRSGYKRVSLDLRDCRARLPTNGR